MVKKKAKPKEKEVVLDLVKTGTKNYVSAKYKFTDAELKEIAVHLAEAIEEKSGLEVELGTIKSEYKSKIDAVVNKIMLNSQYIRNKTEMRRYYCSLTLDFKKKCRKWIDVNTGLVIKTDELYAEDYQTQMDFTEKEKEKAKEKKKGEKKK